MAHLNAALLAQMATTADRANFVYQDPAVRKAVKQAYADVKVAGRSCAALLNEGSASWRRSAHR